MAEHTIKSVDRDVRFECIVMRQGNSHDIEFLRRFSATRWEIKRGDVWWNLHAAENHERARQDYMDRLAPSKWSVYRWVLYSQREVCDLVTLHGGVADVHFKRFPTGEWEINHSDETWVPWPEHACEEALYQAYIKE
jgi:hypothetical protein